MSADYPVFFFDNPDFPGYRRAAGDYARSSWRRTMYRVAKAHVTTIA